MSKYKTLLVTSYIELLVWWVLILVLGERLSVGNSLYSLSLGLFAAGFAIYLAYNVIHYRSLFTYNRAALLFFLGFICYGLGCIFWFYYDVFFSSIVVPFPSASDLWYLMQTVLSFCAFYRYIEIVRFGMIQQGRKRMLQFCFVFIMSIILGTSVAVLLVLPAPYNTEDFLLFYYPYESLSFLVLFIYFYIKYVYKQGKHTVKLIGYLACSKLVWFLADSVFSVEYLRGTFYCASFADLLFATGIFIAYLGFIIDMDEHEKDVALTIDGIYMQKVPYYHPTSLN